MGGALLDRLDRALQVVEFATAVIGGVVIFCVMWVGVAEMIMRKAFNAPLYGQLDLIEQSMATYTLLTISYCYRKAGHIRVDILVGHFTGRRKWIAELTASIAAFALIVLLLPGVLHFFENAYYIGDSTINTQWPTWPSKAAIDAVIRMTPRSPSSGSLPAIASAASRSRLNVPTRLISITER